MKTKVALEKKILNVLENNLNGNNIFMTPEDIAVVIYGNEIFSANTVKFKEMQDDLIKGIKQRMGKVKELAEENGMTIIPRRKPVQNGGEKKFRILGWKILTEGDESFIADELIYKRNNGQSRIDSFNSLREIVIKKGLVEIEKIKKLSQ